MGKRRYTVKTLKVNREEMEERIRKTFEEQEQKIKELEAKSKPLSELVFSENFHVEEVIAESYSTSFTPYSEMVIGGDSPTYKGGFVSELSLEVSPDNKELVVNTLKFEGISAVRAGDYISAKILRYEEVESVLGGMFDNGPGYHRPRKFYIDREFEPEESAVELIIKSEDGKIIRTDRAVNYKTFFRDMPLILQK